MKNIKTFFIKRIAHFVTTTWFIFFSFACTATPTITATNIPSLTFTPKPTSTVTTQPSATITPSPTPTPLIADSGNVIFSESFDDLDFPFNVWGPKRIESGVLILDETPPDQYANGIYGIDSIPVGATSIFLFKTVGGTQFNIGYHVGDYGTEELRRFSFNSASNVWDLYIGNTNPTGGNFPIKTWEARQSRYDTWHYLSITRSINGDIDAKLWEKDNPINKAEFHNNFGSEWGTLEFTIFVDFRSGSFLLDEYQELQ